MYLLREVEIPVQQAISAKFCSFRGRDATDRNHWFCIGTLLLIAGCFGSAWLVQSSIVNVIEIDFGVICSFGSYGTDINYAIKW